MAINFAIGSISALRVSRSFLVIRISLETGRISFNLSDLATGTYMLEEVDVKKEWFNLYELVQEVSNNLKLQFDKHKAKVKIYNIIRIHLQLKLE